jgi:hypothetical protein
VVRHIFQAFPVWIYTQSNIISIIFTWVHYTNTEKLNIVKLYDLVTLHNVVFMYKFHNSLLPTALDTFFTRVTETHKGPVINYRGGGGGLVEMKN